MKSLTSRLVVLGILQLVLLAGTAFAIFVAEGPHEPGRPEEYVLPDMVRRLEDAIDQPAELQHALDELSDHRIEVSLYDAAGQLIATNVEPALAFPRHRRPPGEPRTGAPPLAFPREPHVMVRWLRVHGERGYLVARGVHARPPGAIGPVLVLICGFAIVVAGALLTARWILRPIERLSRTARALGSGNLAARSRIVRSDEIGELGHRIDDMADRIERLLVTEKELLANVAHELRTPLTRIGVALDLAGEGDAEAARAALAEIAVDVGELEAIVDDILTTMRFEIAGGAQLPLRRELVTARTVADAAAERLRARHPERPLVVEVAADAPSIDVDRVLFRRAIDNLLANAHKYTPDTSAPIQLAVTRERDRAVFEVRDRGIGIPAADLPRIFTAFFRGDRSRSRETGGVGLGLTLAKRIVEAHGGTIDVTSPPGAGTTFRVAVPAASAT